MKPLFKKSNTGAIQRWSISTEGNKIITVFGQVNGKMQTVTDVIKAGKNVGRKNETTPSEQAECEAMARWTKQKKKGYVENVADAIADETDDVIEGGILPMLAKKYEDHVDEINFPVAVQPKLDGHRCIALFDGEGKVTLWTRTRKRYTSVPHIVEKLEYVARKMNLRNVAFDGELYNHELKADFEKISSMVRQQDPHPDAKRLVQYHIYDFVMDRCFKERLGFHADVHLFGGSSVQIVETEFVNTLYEIEDLQGKYVQDGYEGAMVRSLGIGYENKRSKQLLKLKNFVDDEFQIVDVEEGRGKLMGHVGAFVCKTKDGKKFNAKMRGKLTELKKFWEDSDLWDGKLLTVKYQGLTGDGLPRFPVGMRLRDEL